MRNNENKQAQSIAKQMKERVAAMNESRNTVENDNKIFDLVLNMNSTSKQKTLANRAGGEARRMAQESDNFGGGGMNNMIAFASQSINE